jgi:hypothetical protein
MIMPSGRGCSSSINFLPMIVRGIGRYIECLKSRGVRKCVANLPRRRADAEREEKDKRAAAAETDELLPTIWSSLDSDDFESDPVRSITEVCISTILLKGKFPVDQSQERRGD